ncbi:MAG: AAA family ATPase [Verrucomicrobiota bacterium]
MRIDRLQIENFKKFKKQSFSLHPQFTLLAGENGSGKTTVLDALAVSLSIWLVEKPDTMLMNSGRRILPKEIRLEPALEGDRVQFRECRPVRVQATGQIAGRSELTWTRQISERGLQTSNAGAEEALALIRDIYQHDHAGDRVLCPVLAYYGAGRAWLPSNERVSKPRPNGPARRWAAFYDCFNERIRFVELQKWFSRETTERGNRGGRWRPGFEVVRRALLRCVPDADDVWFDTDRDQIVLSIARNAQPFDNLSAGQRMMLALVADLAIKAVTQNAFLLPPDELGPADGPWPKVLRETPGVVLIDELDVHLHPRWQRRVATDLKATFPAIQFVCTSHSPQVIGEVLPEEVRLLDADQAEKPAQSFGMDSNWIVEVLMGGAERNLNVKRRLEHIFALIDRKELPGAEEEIGKLRSETGNSDRLQRAASLVERIKLLGR